jgi:hypothetical protein
MEGEQAKAARLVVQSEHDWSGLWKSTASSELLWLRHQPGGRLVGDYTPSVGRAEVCRFSGAVEGDKCAFTVVIKGKPWQCVLLRNGESLTMHGRRDMESLFKEYAQSGPLNIQPRVHEETESHLAIKRREMLKASRARDLGTFERVSR